MARPDVTRWITVGSTVRTDRTDRVTPSQVRHVQIEPSAYDRLVETLQYPDGAMLAATFHPVTKDDAHTPPLYRSGAPIAFALEVIDRGHPDGRRFYVYEGDAASAAALPPGNECAVCHHAQGGFDGTFAQLYPAISHLAQSR